MGQAGCSGLSHSPTGSCCPFPSATLNRREVEPPEAAPALSPRQGLWELLRQGELGAHRLFKLLLVKLCPQPASWVRPEQDIYCASVRTTRVRETSLGPQNQDGTA